LTHEDERDERAQQLQRHRGFEGAGLVAAQHREALAKRPIAHLVVILNEENKRGRGKHVRRLTSRLAAMSRTRLTLIDEALRQGASQLVGGPLRIGGVITAGLAREKMVNDMVGIIIPLRIKTMTQQACGIVIVLEN